MIKYSFLLEFVLFYVYYNYFFCTAETLNLLDKPGYNSSIRTKIILYKLYLL